MCYFLSIVNSLLCSSNGRLFVISNMPFFIFSASSILFSLLLSMECCRTHFREALGSGGVNEEYRNAKGVAYIIICAPFIRITLGACELSSHIDKAFSYRLSVLLILMIGRLLSWVSHGLIALLRTPLK